MRKITNFIVDKRYIILVLLLILSGLSLMISSKVIINYDMTNYLPKDSSTRIGLDIMNKEFNDKSDTSSLNVMVKEYLQKEADDAYNYLSSLDNVSNVTYEYKDEYTIFNLTVDKESDSKEASNIYKKVQDYFGDKLEVTSGDIASHNTSVLPFYVIVIAVISALIILIIMCESYIEPFLFLISILIAVALNSGTNIIFGSVSNITNSISAVLQMALSMDYSIMLMNRYRQERAKEKDKVKAMKVALHNAFKAISSSSVTTIVGLLALVFMSFTIGRDLGFVLAKGVLFSLISIFTCLPCMILICDNLIFKTKKKSINIKMNLISKFAYLFKKFAILVFALIFIVSFFLKGNLGILFTSTGEEKIDKVFASNNQMVIIYPNKEEKKFSNLCNLLSDNENIKEVLCYGNTLNETLAYDRLNTKLEEYDMNTNIDSSLLKILYYYYYNKDINNKVTLNNLLDFIITSDDDIIDSDMKKELTILTNFTNYTNIKKKRTSKEIANTLNIDGSTVKDLFVYYNSKNITSKMSLSEFANFMNKNILDNKKYRNTVDEKTINSLKTLSKFTDKNTINKKMTSKEMANLFGIDENLVDSLYTYYLSVNDINDKLTIEKFASYLKNNYGSSLDDATLANLEILITFSNKNIISKDMPSSALATLFNMEKEEVDNLFLLMDKTEMSPYEFVNVLLSSNIDESKKQSLQTLNIIMTSSLNNKTYTYKEMSNYIGISTVMTKQIYAAYLQKNFKTSPYTFVKFILEHQNDDLLKGNISNISELTFLKKIMDSVIKNTKYSPKELSNFLGIDKDTLNLLYSLYEIDSKKKVINLSYEEFISFLIKNVINNKEYSNLIDNSMKNKLVVINSIIKDSLNEKKYTSNDTYNKLSVFTNSVDKKDIDLLYIYYGSEYNYDDNWTLTLESFVGYLNDDIINNKLFNNYIDEEMSSKMKDAKKTMIDYKKMLVGKNYSRMILNTEYAMEDEDTFAFIESIQQDYNNAYIVGDSPMAYEMSKSFSNELNLITILTMIFIFVVVMITFKSVLVPIILVLLIQCAVFLTMGILSFSNSVYFMSILIVQSILMGATIDYAILYTSYYLEFRNKNDVKDSILTAYNNSIHTILNSSLILMIVTLIVGAFSSSVSARICTTISEGTLCATILVIFLLPAILATFDKYIVKKKVKQK